MKGWRFPTLTVHRVETNSSKHAIHGAIIPFKAKAKLSMRTVPNQKGDEIGRLFEVHIRKKFAEYESQCSLDVEVDRVADWWVSDLSHPFFQTLALAVEEEWNIKPLFIREGGSIPALRWLEKTFKTVALNLPMGQASDAAHLSNERIRLRNLFGGRRIVYRFLQKIVQARELLR